MKFFKEVEMTLRIFFYLFAFNSKISCKFVPSNFGGALIQAEIIPFEPEQVRTCGGKQIQSC